METVLLILTIVIASFSLIASITAIILLLKKKENSNSVNQIQANEEIKASIASLKENIPVLVSKSVSDQMVSISKTLSEEGKANLNSLSAFQTQLTNTLTSNINTLNDKVDANLKDINNKVGTSLTDGFKGTSDSMEKLQKALGEIDEAQKNIQNLSTDVISLKDVLSNNQRRGKFGEKQLEMIIGGLFNNANKGLLYDFQYIIRKTKGDENELKPDAVLFLDGEEHHKIVPIDSKFSLVGYEELFDSKKSLSQEEKASKKSDFLKALKQRADETSKYIIPGTTIDNAIMFIPNDGVFAYIENECPDFVEYAQNKKVILTSPTIIQPLIIAFEAIQIDAAKSKNMEKINKAINLLGNEFKRFAPRWENVAKNIASLNKSSYAFGTTVSKLDSKFSEIQKGYMIKDGPEELIPETEPEEENLDSSDQPEKESESVNIKI